jgi:hypothetical protein
MVRIHLTLGLCALIPSLASAQTLDVSGSCPGTMVFRAEGLPPAFDVALISADRAGGALLPAGPCEGRLTGLSEDGLALRSLGTTELDGSFSMSPTLPAGACGSFVQVVGLDLCGLNTPAMELKTCATDGFEGEVWPTAGWHEGLEGGGLVTEPVHGGEQALMDPNWHFNDTPVGPSGEVSVWTWLGTGRTYLGFDSDAVGTKSFVLAPNSGDIRFQRNPTYEDYEELTLDISDLPIGAWVRATVRLVGPMTAEGSVYDASGARIAGPLLQDYPEGFGGGTVALRAFGGHLVDDLSVCP